MKRSHLLEIYVEIEKLLEKSKKVKLNYYFFAIQDIIEEEKKRLEKIIKPSDKMQEYEQKRQKLCQKFCEKDDNDQPVIKDGVFQGLVNNVDFNSEFNVLKTEYIDELNVFEKNIKEYNEFLEEEIDKDIEDKFKKIPIEIIPDDLMNGKTMKLLKPILSKLEI